MLISSSNKTINTYPLLNLLREGENNADTVTIQLPLQYGDVEGKSTRKACTSGTRTVRKTGGRWTRASGRERMSVK